MEARKKMDLSRWEQMPADQQEMLAAKIVQEAKSGDMPPLQYRLLRWVAKRSKGDVQTLSTLGKGAGVSEAALAGDGDAVHVKAVFEKRCTGCHALEADREGPRLAGVYGRKAGNVAGFYLFHRREEPGRDVERCDAGEMVERSGHGGEG